jgi:predicted S18 family serine protease
MKNIRGIKNGGQQQKIFNLMLIIIIALIGVYAAVSVYQQRNLSDICAENRRGAAGVIAAVSAETMEDRSRHVHVADQPCRPISPTTSLRMCAPTC